MPSVVMDALSHQAIRALGTEESAYGNAPERAGRWRGKRLLGLEAMLAEHDRTLSFARPNADALMAADVLIVASRSELHTFAAEELAAIDDFLDRGGGLLLMANHRGFIAPQQQLAAALALPFTYNDVSIAGFPTIVTSNDKLAHGVERISVRNTASLRVLSGARTIAWFAGDPDHVFAAASTRGPGRIVATGDSGFMASSDDTGRNLFAESGNAQFLANVIDWLAAPT